MPFYERFFFFVFALNSIHLISTQQGRVGARLGNDEERRSLGIVKVDSVVFDKTGR
jgi:hypothetical protein